MRRRRKPNRRDLERRLADLEARLGEREPAEMIPELVAWIRTGNAPEEHPDIELILDAASRALSGASVLSDTPEEVTASHLARALERDEELSVSGILDGVVEVDELPAAWDGFARAVKQMSERYAVPPAPKFDLSGVDLTYF